MVWLLKKLISKSGYEMNYFPVSRFCDEVQFFTFPLLRHVFVLNLLDFYIE